MNTAFPPLAPVLGLSLAGAAVFLLLYYLVFRRWIDRDSVLVMENLRAKNGLPGRVLYGGIVEEILMRWGLLSFAVWIGSLITGGTAPAMIWIAIVVVGLVFGLGHLPAYLGAGCRKTPPVYTAMIVLNMIAALITGYLFWQYGILAAILAHTLFHIVWYPFDLALRLRPVPELPAG